MEVKRTIERCKNKLLMSYLPPIIAYIVYKIIIDKISDTAIKYYRNELDDIPLNYLIM